MLRIFFLFVMIIGAPNLEFDLYRESAVIKYLGEVYLWGHSK